LILQFLHHDATNVNQADKFDWPPLLEACARLDARSASLLVNGGAHLAFRNQHHFDVLKAVDTSKKDLAAKRWMSCLLVSNGFRFDESTVQLNPDDRDTLEGERSFFDTRSLPDSNPPFYVPDHLAPRCNTCKLQFSVTVRRYNCRSCGLVLCGDCFKWRSSSIVPLDERQTRQQVAAPPPGPRSCYEEEARHVLDNESGLNASTEASLRDHGGFLLQAGLRANGVSTASPDDPRVAEELPAAGPPMSVVCPGGSIMASDPHQRSGLGEMNPRRDNRFVQGALIRERGCSMTGALGSISTRVVRLCGSCAPFFEGLGVGETYMMLQQHGL